MSPLGHGLDVILRHRIGVEQILGQSYFVVVANNESCSTQRLSRDCKRDASACVWGSATSAPLALHSQIAPAAPAAHPSTGVQATECPVPLFATWLWPPSISFRHIYIPPDLYLALSSHTQR